MSSRYESLVFDAIPAGCKRALDVGCGNGEITRELRRRGVPEVVGLDRDEPCVQRCLNHPAAGDIRYVVGDLSTADLAPNHFDLVSAVASLHHMDAREGLLQLRRLVAPGGVLVVVGLARPDLPRDLPSLTWSTDEEFATSSEDSAGSAPWPGSCPGSGRRRSPAPGAW